MALVALPSALPALYKAFTHVTNLANIFVKYNAYEVLGIHLIYGHFKILSNAIILGINIDESAIRFLSEFVEYIVNNNLTSLIRLQGTVMLDASIAKNIVPIRITGWQFESVDGNPRVCAHNESHAGITSGNYKVFNARKPLPKLENIE
ncbi:hypothetical protein QBC44DRAFT_346384 [Cladorrhinum sp. PSN332]|nr:hypothetical protein QBC44DRAFT_346384 [Cladorrhinum sp. PSN332]